jgi:WD40 repeat protein
VTGLQDSQDLQDYSNLTEKEIGRIRGSPDLLKPGGVSPMRDFVRKLRASFNSFREAVFNTLFRARFRYDVFISYSHSDAKQYAESLKKQLSHLDFACFLDKEESPPGLSLGPTLEKALKKSAVLVLLATERALTRPYIELEFGRFVAAKRKIIPINIADALTKSNGEALAKAPWNIINEQKLIWIDETAEAFAQQRPSPPIADGIDKLFKYTRRNVRVRAEIIGTAALVLLAAFGAGFVIKGQAAEVTKQASLAETARQQTKEQQDVAAGATVAAELQLAFARQASVLAEEQRQIADKAREEAVRQQEIARNATAEATKQQLLAHKATEEAKRQQAIADQQLERSRQLVYDSDLNYAQRAEERKDLTRLNEVLTNYLPSGSSKDRRGFEWFYYWRLANYKPFALGTTDYVGDMEMSADGKILAAGSEATGLLKVWWLDKPDQVAEVRAHKDRITDLAISWDATTIATASADMTVKLWDIRTPDLKLIKTLRHNPTGVGSVALSRDGKLLAAGLFNKSIRLWDLDKDTPLTTYDGFSEAVFFPAFSPDGKVLIVYDDKTLIQRSTSPPYEKISDVLTNEKIGCVSFSTDGKKLVAGVSANKIRIMDWPDWRNVSLHDAPGTTASSGCPHSLSGDGETLVTLHDGKIFLLDVRSWSTLGSFNPGGWLWDVAMTPDGKRIAVIDSSGVKLWDVRGVQNQATIYTENAVEQVAFNSTGKMIATLGSNKTVSLWDAQTLRQLPGLNQPAWLTVAMALSPGGRIVTGHEDGTLKLWDMQTHEPAAVFKACSKILSLAFAPDEQTLAVGCENGNVELWDTTRGQQLKSLAGHTGPIRSVVFSAEGKLASGSDDKTVRVWETATGRQLWAGTKHEDGVLALAFSADGKLASASKDKTVKLWEVSTGKELLTLTGHKFEVSAVAFAPDGKTMATGGEDKLVKLWDPQTGQELVSFADHGSRVVAVAFSPDGKTLVTGSWDRTFKLWFAARNEEVSLK